MANLHVLEGTWEELKLHDKELSGKRFRLMPLEVGAKEAISKAGKSQRLDPQGQGARQPRQLTGMGKFAGILPSSEEFKRQNQEEIDLEERKFHFGKVSDGSKREEGSPSRTVSASFLHRNSTEKL